MLWYQCFFIERANIFTVLQQHIVLLVIRQYEGKSYHLFVEDWLFEAYHLRIVSYPVITTTTTTCTTTTLHHYFSNVCCNIKWHNINKIFFLIYIVVIELLYLQVVHQYRFIRIQNNQCFNIIQIRLNYEISKHLKLSLLLNADSLSQIICTHKIR